MVIPLILFFGLFLNFAQMQAAQSLDRTYCDVVTALNVTRLGITLDMTRPALSVNFLPANKKTPRWSQDFLKIPNRQPYSSSPHLRPAKSNLKQPPCRGHR
jgi:hypothetical protein